MTLSFIPAIIPPADIPDNALWLVFSGNNLLVYDNDEGAPIPTLAQISALGLTPLRQLFLGTLGDQLCFSVEFASGTAAPAGMAFLPLRQIFLRTSHTWLINLAGRAIQLVDWDRNHQFCSQCGHKTVNSQTERVKQCLNCGLNSYPRLSPSIIVAIHRHNEILLARNVRFPPGMYSVLAGFVEPGETLEETVAREVYEEVELEVNNIRYFGSQPWPFPNSLMLGFTADYAAGEIKIDEIEIEDARWYSVDNLPQLPPKISIARRMIDSFVDHQKKRA